jgi:hypothetical protein
VPGGVWPTAAFAASGRVYISSKECAVLYLYNIYMYVYKIFCVALDVSVYKSLCSTCALSSLPLYCVLFPYLNTTYMITSISTLKVVGDEK